MASVPPRPKASFTAAQGNALGFRALPVEEFSRVPGKGTTMAGAKAGVPGAGSGCAGHEATAQAGAWRGWDRNVTFMEESITKRIGITQHKNRITVISGSPSLARRTGPAADSWLEPLS
jgi:hypothetical protein